MKCQSCNADIPQARLDAVPDTQYCVKCADKHAPPTLVCMDYTHKTAGEFVIAVGDENVRRLDRQNKRSR